MVVRKPLHRGVDEHDVNVTFMTSPLYSNTTNINNTLHDFNN
jgi:hypothetical protein